MPERHFRRKSCRPLKNGRQLFRFMGKDFSMETIGGVSGVFGHDGSYDGTDEAGGDDLTLGMGIGFILMLPMRFLLRRRRRRDNVPRRGSAARCLPRSGAVPDGARPASGPACIARRRGAWARIRSRRRTARTRGTSRWRASRRRPAVMIGPVPAVWL